jgi:hypothetical protein
MQRVIGIVVIGFAVLLFSCKQKEMPGIKDGNKLQQDCVRLMGLIEAGEVPAKLWTRSIKDLEPIRVTRETNNIRILVRQERGKYTVGYDIFSDPQFAPSTQGVWVQKTKFKGVYVFKMPY